ncbi:MAG TPA: DUF4214 domain-containing protein [Gemmataceae bacterium]|jgi:hypothetical protein|nr:DUF4214 domain-containing protein [Gemmataceae bacterium]
MNVLQRLYRNSQPKPSKGRRPRLRERLNVESLESRLTPTATFVVPVNVPADNVTTFHTLNLAMNATGATLVTIEPGASPDLSGALTIPKSGMTIQGDPNVPAAILPSYQLQIQPVIGSQTPTSNVTLNNLNLSSVSIGTATGNDGGLSKYTITNCVIGSLSDFGENTTLNQNTFNGPVKIINPFNSSAGTDVVTNNLFTSSALILLEIDYGFGDQIIGNKFFDDSGETAIKLANCKGNPPGPTLVAHNVINLIGSDVDTLTGVEVEQVGLNLLSFVQISENTISTDNLGTAIHMDMTNGGDFTASADGNDLHGNLIGVAISGDGKTGIGSAASISLDGTNDFRSFKPPASTTSAAIVLQNAPTTAVNAQQNFFSVTPSTVIFAPTGSVDTTDSIVSNAAFVQTLYTKLLGRSASSSEVSFWVSAIGAQGQAGVANDILRSSESLGPIVDKLYIQFLGRQSDSSGRAAWIGFLQNGGTEEQVETAFLASPEYLSHIDTDFVQSLYLNIFGRTGSASELAFWNGNIQKLGLAGIANGFVQSSENRDDIITGYYQTLLDRTPTQSEIAPAVSSSLDLLSVKAEVLSLAEFFNNG